MLFRPHLRLSPARALLVLADIAVIIGSFVLSAIMRLTPGHGWEYVLHHVPSIGGSLLVFLAVFYAGGMYERPNLQRRMGALVLSFINTMIAVVAVVVMFYSGRDLHLGRGILSLSGLLICLGSWMVRDVYRAALGKGLLARKTILIGEGKDVHQALSAIVKTPSSGFRIYGVVCCNKARVGDFIEGFPVLGHVSRIKEFIEAYNIDTVVIAVPLAREHALLKTLRSLRYAGVEILDFVALMEELDQRIPLDHIDDEWLMNAAMNSSVIHIRKIKRMMDIVISLVGLIVLAPIALVAAVAIRLESRGPALYRQKRVGLEGKPYTLLKLRTMKEDAENGTGAVWAEPNDRRATRVGHFLRMWRIDEIPQLINVLRGEMSLVGPRPERPEFVAMLSDKIPFYQERLLVPPGITGWAQVKFPYAASIEAQRRKLGYDLYYIKHMSFFFDVMILLRTFRTIIAGLRHSEEWERDESTQPAQVISVAPSVHRHRTHVAG